MKNSRPYLRQGTGAAGKQLHPNSTKAQLFRFLTALVIAGLLGVSTIQAREQLSIIAPARIIHRLRHDYGCTIATKMREDVDSTGCAHRVAYYVLIDDNGTVKGGI